MVRIRGKSAKDISHERPCRYPPNNFRMHEMKLRSQFQDYPTVAAHSLLMISLARDIETQLELSVSNAE